MKQWYYSKEPGERKIILALGAVIALALIYSLIWAPLSSYYSNAQTQIRAKRELLAWMTRTGQDIIRLQQSQQPGARSSGPLLSTVDNTIKAADLSASMKRLEPQGNNKVQIWFEQAGFDPLVAWLAGLTRQQGIVVENINIERQPGSGLVNVRVILTNGAAT